MQRSRGGNWYGPSLRPACHEMSRAGGYTPLPPFYLPPKRSTGSVSAVAAVSATPGALAPALALFLRFRPQPLESLAQDPEDIFGPGSAGG